MNLESVAKRLEDEEVGVRGKDIFINSMPAEAKEGILLRPPFGGSPIDSELPGYRKTEFMVIVRSKKYEDGKSKMEAAIAALTMGQDNESLENMRVNYMRAHHEPISYAPGAGAVTEFLVNVDACYVIV